MVSTFLLQGPNRGLISFGKLRPLRECCTVFSGKPATRSILTGITGWLKYHVVVFKTDFMNTNRAIQKHTPILCETVIMKIHVFFDAHRLSSTSSCGRVLPHYYWNILHFTINSPKVFLWNELRISKAFFTNSFLKCLVVQKPLMVKNCEIHPACRRSLYFTTKSVM